MPSVSLKLQAAKPFRVSKAGKLTIILVALLSICACDISPPDMKFRPPDEAASEPADKMQECAKPPCIAEHVEKD